MQNLFMPSETVAYIEQMYVAKTYKVQGKAYREPFTKEKISSLFGLYVDAIDEVFGGRAIAMQRTRALKNGTIVPITSFEYVYKDKQSIVTYVDEGYYAVTVNGYRMRDIMDSAYHYFTDSLTGGGKIIENLAMILDIDKDAVKDVLVKFFCDNGFETFDSFLRHIMLTGKMDVYNFDVCASVTCSFGEPIPVIEDSVEIQVMNRRAQDQGLAVDECDLDGWKNGSNSRNARNVCDFFEKAFEYNEKICCPTPADEVEKSIVHDCEPCAHNGEKTSCESCESTKCDEPDEVSDNLDEIRKDIDDENIKSRAADRVPEDKSDDVKEDPSKNEMVDISSASDGNDYTYSITWMDKDGKPRTKTFYGEAAKKMMSNDDHMNEKLKDKCDKEPVMNPMMNPTLGDRLRFFDKRLAKLEMDMRNLQRPVRIRRERDPFDLFGGFHDLFGGF